MNHYPEWWDTTITLFNKYVSSDNHITWYPHVIEGCFYKHVKDKITINKTTIESDTTVCRIRVSSDFVNKRDWSALDSDQKAEKFTLAVGDIIVAGEIEFNIDEYSKGDRSTDLLAEYKDWPGCFVVESASYNFGQGRGNEHYLARGK